MENYGKCEKTEKKNEKAEILMNKLVYLGLPIVELSKIMNEFWYDYEKPKYWKMKKKKENCVIWMQTVSLYI